MYSISAWPWLSVLFFFVELGLKHVNIYCHGKKEGFIKLIMLENSKEDRIGQCLFWMWHIIFITGSYFEVQFMLHFVRFEVSAAKMFYNSTFIKRLKKFTKRKNKLLLDIHNETIPCIITHIIIESEWRISTTLNVNSDHNQRHLNRYLDKPNISIKLRIHTKLPSIHVLNRTISKICI